MQKTAKYQESPRDRILWGEGDIDSPIVRGEDVYLKPKGRVSQEWLTACKEERALTADLIEQIADLSNLATALRQVVNNGGSAGIDGMTVTQLKEWFSHNWQELQSSLLDGSYTPSGVRGVRIRKPKGGYNHVVDLDLEKFFDKVNHDRLMWLLGTRIGDKRALSLIGRFLRSGIMQDGLISQRLQGTPQGGLC